MSYSSVLSHFIMLPFKIAEKLIFNSTKIDRLLALYCHGHNRARQASGFAAAGAILYSETCH